jgi:hypothetical protein
MPSVWIDTDKSLADVQPLVLAFWGGDISFHATESFRLAVDPLRPRSADPQILPEIDVEGYKFSGRSAPPKGQYILRLYEHEGKCSFSIGCLPDGMFGNGKLKSFYESIPSVLASQGVTAVRGSRPEKFLG